MPENNESSNPKPRIETLSDLIFGLALSIGAISLFAKPPSNLNEVYADIIGFGFSFTILIFVWIRYTSIMSVLPVETTATMFLNIIMLFLVSIEPYLFNLVSQFGHVADLALVDNSSVLYALDMGGLMTILAFFTHELTVEERRLVAPELLEPYRRRRNLLFISAGLFFVSVLPIFWTLRIQHIPLRFYFWLAPLFVAWARRVSRSLSLRLDQQ